MDDDDRDRELARKYADPRLIALREQMSHLVAEYVTTLDEVHEMGPNIPTSWVLVIGMTEMEWDDGRERTTTVHDRVPYSQRLGLLTDAQASLLK